FRLAIMSSENETLRCVLHHVNMCASSAFSPGGDRSTATNTANCARCASAADQAARRPAASGRTRQPRSQLEQPVWVRRELVAEKGRNCVGAGRIYRPVRPSEAGATSTASAKAQ